MSSAMNLDMVLPTRIQVLYFCLAFCASTIAVCTFRPSEKRDLLADFDIDDETAFIPQDAPPRLQQPFDMWENALERASTCLTNNEYDEEQAMDDIRMAGKEWRNSIRKWPVLSIDSFRDDLRRLQRAHLVLAWLVNFFIHSIPTGGEEDPTLVPRALAIPLVEVSRAIGIAPVLTYADTVLWNWKRIDPNRPTTIENIDYTNLFSNKGDERDFYMSMASVELRGAEILKIINDYCPSQKEAELTCLAKTAQDLTRLATIVNELSEAMHSIRDTCNPHVFYRAIRPWLDGGGVKGPSGLRWRYEGVEDSENLHISGPSGGQSSIIHALDLFLDIDHEGRRCPAMSEPGRNSEAGFMERMRQYMPGKHRDYLASIRPIRELARRKPILHRPYDSAVMAMKKFRDVHIRIACIYIMKMAKTNSSGRRFNGQEAHGLRKGESSEVLGTGGNDVRVLLNAGRAATVRALLRQS